LSEYASFTVRVVPRASKSEIVGEYNGAFKIRIASPPVDGAANTELIRLLAKAFHVPRNSVEISLGQTSKIKKIRIAGITDADVASVLKGKT
jgi:hypothetical protein